MVQDNYKSPEEVIIAKLSVIETVQDYKFQEGGFEHETTWFVEQAEGSAEGAFWLLGIVGFSELGSTTVLGF